MRLDHIRVNRTLGQPGVLDLMGFLFKNVNEYFPIILRFFSGSATPFSASRKRSDASTPVTFKEIQSPVAIHHLAEFILPQQTVIHKTNKGFYG